MAAVRPKQVVYWWCYLSDKYIFFIVVFWLSFISFYLFFILCFVLELRFSRKKNTILDTGSKKSDFQGVTCLQNTRVLTITKILIKWLGILPITNKGLKDRQKYQETFWQGNGKSKCHRDIRAQTCRCMYTYSTLSCFQHKGDWYFGKCWTFLWEFYNASDARSAYIFGLYGERGEVTLMDPVKRRISNPCFKEANISIRTN
jgi:hypothetical protein